jgi:hypothetical protein
MKCPVNRLATLFVLASLLTVDCAADAQSRSGCPEIRKYRNLTIRNGLLAWGRWRQRAERGWCRPKRRRE